MKVNDPALPVVDHQALEAKFRAMPDLLGELVLVLVQDLPKRREQLRAGMAARDAQKVFTTAHTIKGAVGNFEARRAFATALELEELGRAGKLGRAGEVMAQLERELDLLLDELHRITQG